MVRRTKYSLLLLLLILLGAGFYGWRQYNGNALRHIVLDQCVPDMRRLAHPAPCQQVNLTAGYALLKDKNGPLQYLLLPTMIIPGIESPLLVRPGGVNYFAKAWQERSVLSEHRGRPLPDSALSLAVNSKLGRSQNLLHIHISCLRVDVRRELNNHAAAISDRWQRFPVLLAGQQYLARRLTPDQLSNQSPFRLLHQEVPAASNHMGRFGLALAELPDGALVLLAAERNLWHLNFASSGALQDHSCAILAPHLANQ